MRRAAPTRQTSDAILAGDEEERLEWSRSPPFESCGPATKVGSGGWQLSRRVYTEGAVVAACQG